MKTAAVRITEYGGPEVLRFESVDLPEPGRDEVRLRHTAVGLNFIDIYQRTGLYPPGLPSGLGQEAAGVVEAVGSDVAELKAGDRVVYTSGILGAYAVRRNVPADFVVPIPDDIDDATAAAVFLKGLTAWYLLHRSYRVRRGDPVLLYAAAGGVGSIATQWAKSLGAIVIGVVGSAEKVALARELGCDHVLPADSNDLAAEVRALTDGAGVAAVYDSVGRDTFMTSLDCLRPHGTMVTFGNSSGPVEPFAPMELAKRGSLYVTRPTLAHFIGTRTELLYAASVLFAFLREASPVVRIGQRYPLADVAEAHRALEARLTIGSTILLP